LTGTTIHGGSQTGLIGVGTVTATSIIINNYAEPRPPADQTATSKEIAPCPYPGLAYFGPDDAKLFFGRDEAIGKLATAVGRQSLTALVGASGSGKSSVVLAGLAPQLHRNGGWLFSYFRIGHELDRNPFLALARALVPFYVQSTTQTQQLVEIGDLAQKLATDNLSLRQVFAGARKQHAGHRILLIADQFEETFTLVEDDAVRNHFMDVLLSGFLDPSPGDCPDICLVLTLRADFYGRALRYRPLSDALQTRVENLGPMTRSELEAAIAEPARTAKVTFEPGLVQTLLDDVERKPGSLPLLQFALREMWGRQRGAQITRNSYDEIGGVEGALAMRAEAIFGRLTGFNPATQRVDRPEVERDFRLLFTRLVRLGEGQEDTRRVAVRNELGDTAWPLAQRLAGEENRLVVTNAPVVQATEKAAIDGDKAPRETVEVVHEALIRHWPRLVEWIDRDRELQSWLAQIRSNIDIWLKDRSDESPLLRGGMLAQGVEWLAKRRDDLNAEEQDYIQASVGLQRREEEKKEAAAKAELKRQQELADAANRLAAEQQQRAADQAKLAEEQRHRAMVARVFGLVAGCVAFLAVILAVGFIGASSDAEDRSRAAFTAAVDSARQTARAQSALAQIENDNSRYFEAAYAALSGIPANPSFDSNPDQLACWAQLLRAAAADGFLVPPMQHQASVQIASFDPTGERVVTTSDKTARIWDVHTGEPIGKPMQHRTEVWTASFDPKGERVVTTSDSTARIWDARTGEPIGKPMQHQYVVGIASFDPTGERVVTAFGYTTRIWDARTGEPIGKPMPVRPKGRAGGHRLL
jgi:WD domain, G-beta repeat